MLFVKIKPVHVMRCMGYASSLTLLATLFVGCKPSAVSPQVTTTVEESPKPKSTHSHPHKSESKSKDANNAAEHEHLPGAHGGTIVEIGADSYHAEFVVESNGTVRMFTLGKDEAKVQEIESQTVRAFVKSSGTTEAIQVELQPTPQDGDSEGQCSQFVGQLPKELAGQAFDLTIPSLKIAGERFRLGFRSESDASHDASMPTAASDDESKSLYEVPGGKYTQADIDANGTAPAAKKFKGVMSNHNLKPQSGDLLCPVTLTKANEKFTWMIDGKAYQFCCPPCIDEFVKLAKEHPEDIKAPEEYVKE